MLARRGFVTGAVVSAAAAVGFAGHAVTLPRRETFSFPSDSFDPVAFVAACGCLGLVWAVAGALLVCLRPRNVIGWLVLAVGVSQAWAVGLSAYGGFGLLEPVPSWPVYVGTALYVPGWLLSSTLLLAFYPDGRLAAPRWRWPVAGAAASIMLLAACVPVSTVPADQTHGWAVVPAFPDRLAEVLLPHQPMYQARFFVTPTGAAAPVAPTWWPALTDAVGWTCKPLLALCMLAIWIGTVRRLLRARPPQRQQLCWLVCVVMPCLPASLVAPIGLSNLLLLAPMLLVPAAVAIGVLRYRLLGIETVMRRGLVYGILTTAVIAVYLLVSAALGMVLDRRPLPSAGVVAAAVAAVGLAPARGRLQRGVDRFIYGECRDPLRAVSLLAQRVAVAGEAELLPAALTSVLIAMNAPAAALIAADGRCLANLGPPSPWAGRGTATLPLRFGGHQLGELVIGPRSAGETYTPAELRLLAALAGQVAVVVRATELTQALQAERDRVLAATTTERDRIRTELHDGLGPSLSGISLGLQAIPDNLDRADRPATDQLLARIRDEVDVTLSEVRRIIDGLRPTVLDTMALPEAIRRHAQTLATVLPIDIVAAPLPALPPEVENAAYRITAEALNNAVRHAKARRVEVRLIASARALHVTISDDGCGLPRLHSPGRPRIHLVRPTVGLASMRGRAVALGGTLTIDSGVSGTTVTAILPLEKA